MILSSNHPNSWQVRSRRGPSKRVTRIVNVYQPQRLSTGEIPQGFGDYIRGSLSVLQTATKLGIEFDMAIHHPLAQWLRPVADYKISLGEIKFIATHQGCIKALNQCLTSTLFVYVHAFPDPVSESDRTFVWTRLQPNDSMAQYRAEVYASLKIVPRQYEVIHVRCGDHHIQDLHRHFQTNEYESYTDAPSFLVREALARMRPGTTYVVLSDNAALKRAIRDQFDGAIVRESEILHLGTSETFAAAGVRDTLLDFYLITDAARVTAFSTYSHGSGFSQWACELRNVPYTCTFCSNAQLTVVYKTYGADLPWIKYSLQSLQKFVVYYTSLVLYCHDEAVAELHTLLDELSLVATVIPVTYTMHGYIQQMVVKAESYKDIDTPYVVILDSDVVFTASFDLRTLVDGKIHWTYSTQHTLPGASEWKVWKSAYEAMTRTSQTMHFMSNHFPFVLTRASMETAAVEFQRMHGMNYSEFCRARLQQLNIAVGACIRENFEALATVFEEFEWLGFSCMHHSPHDYTFSTSSIRKVPCKQFWSHGGIDAVQEELKIALSM